MFKVAGCQLPVYRFDAVYKVWPACCGVSEGGLPVGNFLWIAINSRKAKMILKIQTT
jgi:hypothetical protein